MSMRPDNKADRRLIRLRRQNAGSTLSFQVFSTAASLLGIWLATGLYCEQQLMRLMITAALTPFLLFALRRQQAGRRLLVAREQFKWFLELLLTELSTGAAFEHAFHQTVHSLSSILKERSALFQTLIQVDQQLKASRPTTVLLRTLSLKMICPEARIFFKLLPDIQTYGSPIAPFVRQQLRNVIEQLAMLQNLQAETAQRRTEAMILVLMPFLITGVLNTSWDPVLVDEPVIVTGRLAACLLALFAGMLTVLFTASPTTGTAPVSCRMQSKRPLKRFEIKMARLIQRCYRDYLPAAHGPRLIRVITDLESISKQVFDHSDDWVLLYFVRKMYLIGGTCLLSLAICLQMPAAWPCMLLPFLAAWLQDQKWLDNHRRRLDAYGRDYPVLLNLWSSLLQTGLSLGRSLQVSCEALASELTKGNRKDQVYHVDLDLIQKHLQAGQSASSLLTALLSICPVPEIQTALLLMMKYEQLGGAEALQMIQLQASALWTLHRTAVRSQLEKQGIRLLMPMMMSLIAVLITALLPAVASIRMF